MAADLKDKYELVVGLEVHVQLNTQSKVFSADPATYGAGPNEHVSAVTLGHPGTLPFLNKKAVENAVKMGLACHCDINLSNHFARKNYFYADLPKGYQISQHLAPICQGGFIMVKLFDDSFRKVAIHHIHLEEDAGKSLHDQHSTLSLIDLNRAGVPLLEIVSEPDIRSAAEAGQYIAEIRRLVRYLDISDGNMEEGSLRCDANISVRLRGANVYGNRCEVKNLNSIRNVQRAIEHEFSRQVAIVEAGGHIDQNTLNFDADTGETSVLRSKEMANDYRYFPEPDLPPLLLTKEYVKALREEMPPLPEALYKKYTEKLGLSAYDAGVITADHRLAQFFEMLINHTGNYKAVANWVIGPLKNLITAGAAPWPATVAAVVKMITDGELNYTVAVQQLLPQLLKAPDGDAESLAHELNLLITVSDSKADSLILEALAKFPDKVSEYRKGKKGVVGLFMGEIMKRSGGKIDPKKTNQLLIKALETAE